MSFRRSTPGYREIAERESAFDQRQEACLVDLRCLADAVAAASTEAELVEAILSRHAAKLIRFNFDRTTIDDHDSYSKVSPAAEPVPVRYLTIKFPVEGAIEALRDLQNYTVSGMSSSGDRTTVTDTFPIPADLEVRADELAELIRGRQRELEAAAERANSYIEQENAKMRSELLSAVRARQRRVNSIRQTRALLQIPLESGDGEPIISVARRTLSLARVEAAAPGSCGRCDAHDYIFRAGS